METVTTLAARLDVAAIMSGGVVIAPRGTPVDELPSCDPAEQLGSRPLLRYLSAAEAERFSGSMGVTHFSGQHSVTPTPIAFADLRDVVGLTGAHSVRAYALLLRPDRLTGARGPRYLTDHNSVFEYVLSEGFSSDAILTPGVIPYDAMSEVAGRLVSVTVLFTDIVESTARSAELRDEAWRTVVDQHDHAADSMIGDHSGRKIKSMGDGVLAVFDRPSDAVRCGSTLCRHLADLGIQIRAGLHTGEVLFKDGDVSGIAVALAKRVESRAGPGEVWVSRTVRDELLGSDLTFEDRGLHELKGIPDTWTLYEAMP